VLPTNQYVSILSRKSPFIIGINKKYNDSIKDNILSLINQDENMPPLIIVDIDNKLTTTEYLISNHKMPQLPNAHQLQNSLLDYFTKIIKSSSKKEKEEKEVFIKKIRNFIFQNMIKLLLEYEKSLNKGFYTDYNVGRYSIENLFHPEDFYKKILSTNEQFYRKFVGQSKLFKDFIYKNFVPNNLEEQLEILFFKEKIIEKQGSDFFVKKVRNNKNNKK